MPISTDITKEVEALIAIETSNVANRANISAHLKDKGGWHWVGFYIVEEESEELVLGPFQGPIACTRLKKGKGVCAKSWIDNATVVVPNVHDFEGHVACSSLSNSELVITVRSKGKVVAVIDIDSVEYDDFSTEQIRILEEVVFKLEERWVD